MLCYQRKTSFIGYYINGIKSRSIGVVKQCLAEEKLELLVDIFGLEDWKNFRCQVSIGNAKERKQIFEVDVCNGRGRSTYSLPVEVLRKINASKIFFGLGNDCYGIADLCEVPEKKDKKIRNNYSAANRDVEICNEGVKSEDSIFNADMIETNQSEIIVEDVSVDTIEDMHTENEEERELLNDCLEPQPDKWEVIKKKYPILYPFKGQGPYVSIKLVDLQLLDSKYQHLSNNSFLMHNFYQYKHLILGEYAWEKGTFFYVGVPGEFVKKEQNMAAMFGFEGYEHSGDLGYYLHRVAL